MANKNKLTIRFKKWDCVLSYGQYGNGRTAVQLIGANDGYPVCTATVNFPNEELPKDADYEYVLIKDYSENEGILEVLVSYGVVSKPVYYTTDNIPVCKLLITK